MSKPQTFQTVFNNADSFAQAFDEAWARQGQHEPPHDLSATEKLEQILGQLHDHPFMVATPQLARQVAEFRIRLLGL